MSIHFISGKPGGGKSMYAMKLLIEELLFTRRPIVTNLAVNFAGLGQYMEREHEKWYLEQTVHIRDRITILSEDELSVFFTYRGNGVRIEPVSNQQWKDGKRPDFTAVTWGVAYFLDEIHIAFNARAWQDTGHQVLYYNSQHRKLGDDVVCITQSVTNVDKQFRSVAQDFTYLRNLSKEKLGMFKLPSMFMRRTYLQPAASNDKPMETGTFSLDVSGVGACYDTAAGVGIHGRTGADTKEKKKGLHWSVAPIALALICLAFYYGSTGLLSVMFNPKIPKPPVKAQPQAQQQVAPSQHMNGNTGVTVPTTNKVERPVPLGYVTGKALVFSGPMKNATRLYLSTGNSFIWEETRSSLTTDSTRGFFWQGDYYTWYPEAGSRPIMTGSLLQRPLRSY